MSTPQESTGNRERGDRVFEVVVRLAFVGLITVWCGRIIAPFLMPVLWGLIIATALYPAFLRLKRGLGGRNRLAGVVFIVVSLVVVMAPTLWLADSVIGGASRLGQGLEDGTLVVPAPAASVKDWPVIGERVYGAWSAASTNLSGTIQKYAPQLRPFGSKVVAGVAALGHAVVQTIIALILAGVFMINAVGGGRIAYAFADRLDGRRGRELVDLSIATIRSVVRGVLLVALIQGALAAVGLVVAAVPAPGFWAVAVMIVAVVQLPPLLVLGPIAIYVFSANESTAIAIGFLLWSLLVSGADSVLKTVLLGRGVAVPMLVILVGAIGGLLHAGFIGLFVGAVILAIGYKLVRAWLADSLPREGTPTAST